MSDWIVATMLGIIEGITEFLPVSSTGHLLIAEHWLPHQTDLFNIVIQSGAVLAVVPLFWEQIGRLLFGLREKANRDYGIKLFAAFVITGVGGLILDKAGLKLPDKTLPIAIALIVGGVLFVLVERRLRGRTLSSEMTWAIAAAIGFGQLIAAAFPGSSRSGVTIILMLILGMDRVAATEATFLVGIPTMLAAGALKIFKALHHAPVGAPAENWTVVTIGFLVSAMVSFVVVKWLLGYVRSHTFVVFGWYRIVIGALLLLFMNT